MPFSFRTFPVSLRRMLIAALVAALLVALWKFVVLLRHETLGSYYSDVGIYLAVGRGLLNGLTPYVDLFETKPPGIFLLSALSLRLFNGADLLLWTEAFLLALLPLVIVAPVLRAGERGTRTARILITALFGILLTLYVGDKAGQGLSESFGAFFAAGVVALMAHYPRRFPWVALLGTALLFFIAVFIKEPFAISLLGAAVLLSAPPRAILRMAMPVVIAGILFVLALLLLGVLQPYVTLYLGHMLGHQIAIPWGVTPDPLWLRTIHLPRLWATLYSSSPLLPVVLFTVWFGALVLPLLRIMDTRGRILWSGQWLLASWFVTLSVGISGDFYGHQFVFAVPAYAAFFFVCVRENVHSTVPFTRLASAAWCGLLCIALLLQPVASSQLPAGWTQRENDHRAAAKTIDDVLDRCGVDRYLLLINANEGIYAFTRHSPLGPLFTQYARFIGGNPLFIESFGRQFHTAPIAIDKDGEPRPLLDEESIHEFQTAFTDEAPACAGEEFVQPVPYRVLFRIGAEPMR